VESYLALEFPGHRFPPDLPEILFARTEGSPLFLVDVLKDLKDLGIIAESGDAWTLTQLLPDLERELPASIRSLIERKIDRVSPEQRQILVAASVQGHEFDSAVVARALASEAEDIEEQFGELERTHRLVRAVGEVEHADGTLGLRYRFVHILYQNALYAALGPSRRAATSRKIAEAMEALSSGHLGRVAAQLGFLFETARNFSRAAEYFLLAAQHSWRLHATHELCALVHGGGIGERGARALVRSVRKAGARAMRRISGVRASTVSPARSARVPVEPTNSAEWFIQTSESEIE